MNYKLKKFNIYEKCINCKKNCILNIILLKFTFKKFLINLNFEKIIRKSFLYLCLIKFPLWTILQKFNQIYMLKGLSRCFSCRHILVLMAFL